MHTLKIADPAKPQVYEFNGDPDEQAKMKAIFDANMTSGFFMATRTATPEEKAASPRTDRVQIDEFDPHADILLAPALRGG